MTWVGFLTTNLIQMKSKMLVVCVWRKIFYFFDRAWSLIFCMLNYFNFEAPIIFKISSFLWFLFSMYLLFLVIFCLWTFHFVISLFLPFFNTFEPFFIKHQDVRKNNFNQFWHNDIFCEQIKKFHSNQRLRTWYRELYWTIPCSWSKTLFERGRTFLFWTWNSI